jgi:hypothetical protein
MYMNFWARLNKVRLFGGTHAQQQTRLSVKLDISQC